MEYFGNNDYRDYLAHHGILGMRWGKRNGPPYPLGASDHSASERKAGWRKSLSGGGGGGTPTKKKTSNKSKVSTARSRRKERLAEATEEVYRKTREIEAPYKRFQNLSEKDTKREGKVEEEYLRKVADIETRYKLERASEKQAKKNPYRAKKKEIKAEYKETAKSLGNRTKLSAEDELKLLKAGVKQRNQLNELKNQKRRAQGKKEKDYSEKNSVTQKMKISSTDTKITQRVKRDYNNLSDKDFFRTYGTTKKVYKKRVDKYGDPYAHAMRLRQGVKQAKSKPAKTNSNKASRLEYGVLGAALVDKYKSKKTR